MNASRRFSRAKGDKGDALCQYCNDRDRSQMQAEKLQELDTQKLESLAKVIVKGSWTRRGLEGRRQCGSRCLVFMPHCGKALFNNLLWANWGSGLAHLVILGNSFSSFLERIPGRILKETGNFIVSIEPYMREVGVDNTFHHTDIFNDMSLHWFPLPSLAKAGPDFWNRGEPPKYEEGDTEIITKKGTDSEDGHLSPHLNCR